MPKENGGHGDERLDLADIQRFLEDPAEDTDQQPHHAEVVKQTDQRGNKNDGGQNAEGEDKAGAVKQHIHLRADQ